MKFDSFINLFITYLVCWSANKSLALITLP
jgi:hypothetical protein